MSIRSIFPLVVLATFPACSDPRNTSPADSTTAEATVRLANATDAALDLRQGSSVVDGGSNLSFGGTTPCTKVTASAPALTVTNAGKTSNLAGFDPSLDAGRSYTLVAFPGGGSATSFAFLLDAFRPSGSAAGFRVLNANSEGTFDSYVTTPGAALTTPTTSRTEAGTASALVAVPAGTRQIRITPVGSHTVLIDAGLNRLNAGTNNTLVIAPPASGKTALRAFLVTAC